MTNPLKGMTKNQKIVVYSTAAFLLFLFLTRKKTAVGIATDYPVFTGGTILHPEVRETRPVQLV